MNFYHMLEIKWTWQEIKHISLSDLVFNTHA